MGVEASGATLEIQLVADVARLKRDMATMRETIDSATASAGKSFAGMSAQTVNSAAQMAAAAQASARAAVGMAGGLKTAGMSAANARIVTLEMFHVTRSLTEQLATGVNPARAFAMEIGRIATAVQYSGGSVTGLIKQFAAWAGIIKVTQDAELAEAAAQKAAIAAAVQSRAERAAATLQAREVDVALAQAQLAAAATADAEAAAQARLVKALRAVEVAAGKSAIANDALATAQAEAGAAAAASEAKTVRSLSGTSVALGSLAVAAGIAFAGIKAFQAEVGRSGEIDRFAEGLRLTDAQIKKAGGSVRYLGDGTREVSGLTVTMGNIMSATFDVVLERAGVSAKGVQSAWQVALANIAEFGKFTISILLAGFASLIELTVSAGKNMGALAVGNYLALTNPLKDAKDQLYKTFNEVEAGFDKIGARAIALRKAQLQAESDANKPPKPKHERKQGDHGLAQALAELDAQIRGQLRLAEAYQISDAAAIKAEALQKAEEQAIRHKGEVGVFYEKELALAVAQRMADGARTMADIHAEAAARTVVNDLVEQGAIGYRDMGRALEEQQKKRQLMAALEVAEDNGWLERAADIREEIYKLAFAQKVLNDEVDRGNALQELGRLNEQHQTAMALLERETQLTGVNKDQRDEILKLLKQELELRQQFPGMTQEEINKVVQQTAAEDNLRKHLDQVEAGMDQLRQTGEQMIDTVFNIDNWKDPLDLALQLVKQLEQSFVTLGFANPLKNMMFGENLPTLDSVGGVGGFFKGVVGKGAANDNLLTTAGTTLSAAGTGLNAAAIALQGAATALSAAAAASGVGSAAGGAGGILGALLGAGGGAAAGGAADFSFLGSTGSADLDLLYGMAGGGAFTVGGFPGTDKNVLSINGKARAKVSGDETIMVIPRNLPGMKGGGILGALSFLSPALFLQQHHLLRYMSPGAFLGNKLFGGGDSAGGGFLKALSFLSPLLFLQQHHLLKYLSPGAMAADALLGGGNGGGSGGHTFNINVVAPNTGDASRDRQTSMQQAADIRMAVAGAAAKGLI